MDLEFISPILNLLTLLAVSFNAYLIYKSYKIDKKSTIFYLNKDGFKIVVRAYGAKTKSQKILALYTIYKSLDECLKVDEEEKIKDKFGTVTKTTTIYEPEKDDQHYGLGLKRPQRDWDDNE